MENLQIFEIEYNIQYLEKNLMLSSYLTSWSL